MVIADGYWHLGGHRWMVLDEVRISPSPIADDTASAELGAAIVTRTDGQLRSLCGGEATLTYYDDPGSARAGTPVGRVIAVRGRLDADPQSSPDAAPTYRLTAVTAYRETMDGVVIHDLADAAQ